MAGLPAVKHDDWITEWRAAQRRCMRYALGFETIDVLNDIVGEPDMVFGDDAPSRKPKPFLKPSRQHWWQFWRQTDEQFAVWLDKKCSALKRRRGAA